MMMMMMMIYVVQTNQTDMVKVTEPVALVMMMMTVMTPSSHVSLVSSNVVVSLVSSIVVVGECRSQSSMSGRALPCQFSASLQALHKACICQLCSRCSLPLHLLYLQHRSQMKLPDCYWRCELRYPSQYESKCHW